MSTAYLVVAGFTAAANALSAALSIARPEPIVRRLRPEMEKVGVPVSWAVFPIGALKMAGAAGLVLGMLGVPVVGAAAAIGLVLFFVCAAFAHVRVSDYSQQFFGASIFLALAVATLVLTPS